MDSPHWPLILIEGVLVFGGALVFGWWQLRSVKRDRELTAASRKEQLAQERAPDPPVSASAPTRHSERQHHADG